MRRPPRRHGRPLRHVPLLLVALATGAAGCGNGQGTEGPATVPISDAELRRAAEAGRYEKPLGAAVRLEPARDDPAFRRAFLGTFTSMTPENALKWDFVQPERGEYDFAEADALVDAATRAGKAVRGHTLVWDQQLPGWVANADWSREELIRVMRDHIRTVVSRYRGRIAEWDVVNEPFDEDGDWTRSVWYRTLGPEFVAIAFRTAREADPEARLYLNEVGAEFDNPRSRSLLRLVRRLRRHDVPIDGVGFQNHTTVQGFATAEQLSDAFAPYRELGLEVAITEMDVVIPEELEGTAALGRQALAYAHGARACLEAPHCSGLTVWGVTDRWSWKGPALRPLPFDEDGTPKPAVDALLSRLRP